MYSRYLARTIVCLVAMGLAAASAADQRRETFDQDPGWDGLNNRSAMEMRPVVQDFGYVPPSIIPGGAIGGRITPDGKPAYYARVIPEATLDDRLEASGTLTVKKGGGNVLLGFFNSSTVNEWRTPNSLVFRINGRGDTFHAHTEYATSKWRASAGVFGRHDAAADRIYPVENPSDATYRWTMSYDPKGNDGNGAMTATLNEMTAVMNIDSRLRADGAIFNRFGFLTVVKHADGGGDFFVGGLEINGEKIDLREDPKWDARGNHAAYSSEETRPRFNFGYSETHFAGGKTSGEIGGLFFRGDCRMTNSLAYYGAKTDTLTLDKPLHASGKVTFRRGVSDSTTLFGFFHAEHSVKVTDSQADALPSDFAGFAIEGPSGEGFFAYPTYRTHAHSHGGNYDNAPHIYPDATSHDWQLTYDPPANAPPGKLTLALDKTTPVTLEIPADHLAEGASFNRFGFVTPWVDGNGQIVYLDDLEYTVKQ